MEKLHAALAIGFSGLHTLTDYAKAACGLVPGDAMSQTVIYMMLLAIWLQASTNFAYATVDV